MPESINERRVASNLATDYTSYYGLSADPFAQSGKVFFATKQLEKLLRLVDYLSHYSDKIIIVTAPQGAGKSSLVQQFLARQSSDQAICKIKALRLDTPSQILSEVAGQWGTRISESTLGQEDNDNSSDQTGEAAFIEALRNFACSAVDDGDTRLILVDDAHLLSESVIQVLLALVRARDEVSVPIRLLLFGEESLQDSVRKMVETSEESRPLFLHRLSPFALEETKQYLSWLFEQQGDLKKNPLSEKDYVSIQEKSQGVPQRIDEEARQILVEGVSRLLRQPSSGGVRRYAAISAAVAALALGSYLSYGLVFEHRSQQRTVVQDSQGKPPERKVLRSIERQKSVEGLEEESVGALAVNSENGENIPYDFVNSDFGQGQTEAPRSDTGDPVDNKLAEAAGSGESTPTSNEETPPQIAQVPAEEVALGDSASEVAVNTVSAFQPLAGSGSQQLDDSSEPGNSLERGNSPELENSPEQENSPELETTPDAIASAFDGSQAGLSASEQAILGFNARHYTLQLVGSSNKKRVVELFEKAGGVGEPNGELAEDGGQLRIYESLRNDASWYVLVYGNYVDADSANAAARSMPPALSSMKPWIRTWSGIQIAIRNRSEPL